MLTNDFKDLSELAKVIYIRSGKTGLFDANFLKNLMLKLSMKNPKLKNQLFRFVDLLPNLNSSEDLRKYLFEYLAICDERFRLVNKLIPKALTPLAAQAVKAGVSYMARSYIAGSNLEEVSKELKKLKRKKQFYTLDILGEHTLSNLEAEDYKQEIIKLIRSPLLSKTHGETKEQCNISIKLSSICAHVKPSAINESKSKLKDSLRGILREARAHGVFINIDIESYDWRDLSYAVIREILVEEEFKNWSSVGTVLQAYLKDSENELNKWRAWAKERGTAITLRLVKGAYWDHETALAEQRRWQSPVFSIKAETDANFEKLSILLLDSYPHIKTAIASHNIRSLAHAIHHASKTKLKDFEIQVLYGMVNNLKDYLSGEGYKVRVYVPYGELLPGMSYLVRRLLENTANESFLKLNLEGKALETMLRDPVELIQRHSATQAYSNTKEGSSTLLAKDFCILPAKERETFVNNANLDLRDTRNQQELDIALERTITSITIPLLIAERELTKNLRKQKTYTVSSADTNDVEDCIHAASKSLSAWRSLRVEERAEILRRSATRLKSRRYEFNALLVSEVSKTWAEADAEVSEAIDFLEYYAKQAEELFDENRIVSLRGERNTLSYRAYGVAAVIAPWNFPLAILTGMTAASLVTGNTVIVKPSEESPRVGYEIIKIIKEEIAVKGASVLGLEGVLNFLTGPGKLIGNALVENPAIKLVAFTGSEAVGRSIYAKSLANNARKQVVAEMGGKNAILIDETADLDEAIPAAIQSAFGFGGQKCSACSRLIVVDAIYEKLKSRLIAAMQGLRVGAAFDLDSDLSEVISASAKEKILNYIKLGKRINTEIQVPSQGNYVSPSVFEVENYESALKNPNIAKLLQEEIFGPVLMLIKAKDLDDAIKISNDVVYGLTGGIFSRSPANITKARNELEVGNLYINRGCTGAIVSRQAFGGLKNSSIGYKAGGPNYLLQFVQEQCFTENTMRKGFEA